jgi:sialic acid synthase SpsE
MKNKVFIITEAGVNHNGSIDIAKKLIDVALSARADVVKFQTFKTVGALFLQQSVDNVD